MLILVIVIARLLYFAQFTFNAIFLTAVIYRLRKMGVEKMLTPTPTPTPSFPRSRSAVSQYRHQHHSGAHICMTRLSPSPSLGDCFIGVPEKGDTIGVDSSLARAMG
jgi:hypothetical protein